MSFNDLMAAADAIAFAHLADDPLATWTRPSVFSVALPAMLDTGDQAGGVGDLPILETVTVVRVSAADVERLRPSDQPRGGDSIRVSGVLHVLQRDAWRDRAQGGHDWLCPVTG